MHRLLSIVAAAALIALAAPTAVFAADEQKAPTPEPAVTEAAASPAPAARGWGGRGGQCPWAAVGLGRGAAWGGPWWANGSGGRGFGRGAGYRGGRGWGAQQGRGLGLGPYFVDQDGDGVCDRRQALPQATQ